jgi:hypothetical protein
MITLNCDTCGKKVEEFSAQFEITEMRFGPKRTSKYHFCDSCMRTVESFIKLEFIKK